MADSIAFRRSEIIAIIPHLPEGCRYALASPLERPENAEKFKLSKTPVQKALRLQGFLTSRGDRTPIELFLRSCAEIDGSEFRWLQRLSLVLMSAVERGE